MDRGVHPFRRAFNLMIGFGLLFGGVATIAVNLVTQQDWDLDGLLGVAAITLGAAWIYSDLLDPVERRQPTRHERKAERGLRRMTDNEKICNEKV